MKKIRVLQNVITGGRSVDAGVGDFDDDYADHLVEIGVAEAYETKVVKPEEIKKKQPGSVSRQGQASRKRTAKNRESRD